MGRCPRRNALRPKPDTCSLSGLRADRRVLEPGSIPVLAVSADGRTADVRCLTADVRDEYCEGTGGGPPRLGPGQTSRALWLTPTALGFWSWSRGGAAPFIPTASSIRSASTGFGPSRP